MDRAIDQNGQLIDISVSKKRDTAATTGFFTTAVAAHVKPVKVTTDKAIFQTQPFLAVKDIYENYRVLACQSIGTNQWITSEPVPMPRENVVSSTTATPPVPPRTYLT